MKTKIIFTGIIFVIATFIGVHLQISKINANCSFLNIEALAQTEETVYSDKIDLEISFEEKSYLSGNYIVTLVYQKNKTTGCSGTGIIECSIGATSKKLVSVTETPIVPDPDVTSLMID